MTTLSEPYRFDGDGIDTDNIAVLGMVSINDDKTVSDIITNPKSGPVLFLLEVSGHTKRMVEYRYKTHGCTAHGWRPRRESWHRRILTDGNVFYNMTYKMHLGLIASRRITMANRMGAVNHAAVCYAIKSWLDKNALDAEPAN